MPIQQIYWLKLLIRINWLKLVYPLADWNSLPEKVLDVTGHLEWSPGVQGVYGSLPERFAIQLEINSEFFNAMLCR